MGDCRQLANPFRSDFADGQHEVFRRGQSVQCFNFEKLFRMLLQHRRCERSEFFSEFNFLIHDPLYVGIGRVCQNTASPHGPWSPLETSLEPANDFCFRNGFRYLEQELIFVIIFLEIADVVVFYCRKNFIRIVSLAQKGGFQRSLLALG